MRTARGLWLAVAAGVAASLVILWGRWGMEAGYRSVEIVLDGPDWQALAQREGRDPSTVLADAARRGATSVALYERTLKRMAERGEIAYLSAEDAGAVLRAGNLPPAFAALQSAGAMRSGALYVTAAPETLGWLEDTLAGTLGRDRVRGLGRLLEIRGFRDDLEELGLGFRAEDLAAYRRLGLQPVLRLRNQPALTAEGLAAKGAALARLGRGYPVVFELTDVLGFERLLPETAAALRAAGDRYGRIEVFSAKRKQRGEDRLGQEMRPDVIRLFSLTPEELVVLPSADARDKFVRGARERNIRLLYVRPFLPTAGVSGTESNLSFVAELAADLRRFGLRPGRAEPLPDRAVPALWRTVAGAGAIAAMLLTLRLLGEALGAPLRPGWTWGSFAAGVALTAGAFLTGILATLVMKLLALGTAATLPAAGIALALPTRAGSPLRAGVRALWVASGIAALGGVLVAALLTRWDFMMAADVFLGVKVAQLLPVLLVALLLWRYDRPSRHWRQTARELWDWAARPLLLRYAIAAVVVAVAAVMLLARSGNFGLPLLGAEQRLRTVTEDLLVARPRTKEYLIGHPALLLAGSLAAAGWRAWVLPLAAVGAVGQGGLVNSFSHIHTPLLYTVWRTLNALWLGTLLGAAAVLVLLALAARGRRAPPRGRTS